MLLSDVCSEGGSVQSPFFLQIFGFPFLLLKSTEAAETPCFIMFSVLSRFTFSATLWNAQIPNVHRVSGIPILWSKTALKNSAPPVVSNRCFLTPTFVVFFFCLFLGKNAPSQFSIFFLYVAFSRETPIFCSVYCAANRPRTRNRARTRRNPPKKQQKENEKKMK